ncbi:hypothetical protein CDAR_204051 [Caerostris darwini]|uniref:Uncharacterized protein n=1 Tax=Caerostris darwini TaxID=1538125 RepID=A0AAV4RS01_9ARAC|nr:hypothetical protein CDAR_204051 [Caerostris darwini]
MRRAQYLSKGSRTAISAADKKVFDGAKCAASVVTLAYGSLLGFSTSDTLKRQCPHPSRVDYMEVHLSCKKKKKPTPTGMCRRVSVPRKTVFDKNKIAMNNWDARCIIHSISR